MRLKEAFALTGYSRYHKIIILSMIGSAVVGWVDLSLAAVPLALAFLLILSASFLHQLNLFVPAINRNRSGKRVVALTFDDGPDPRSTPALLHLLARYRVQATFFVIGERVCAHPGLISEILRHGHTIGNHGYRHDPLAAFKGARRVMTEISATQDLLTGLGVTPLVFRPPVGITYPAMGTALSSLQLTAVTFSCRAWDRGNRAITSLSKRILKRVRPGDIIMLHDSWPPKEADAARWLNEVLSILKGLEAKGLAVQPLAELIGRPVDHRLVDNR